MTEDTWKKPKFPRFEIKGGYADYAAGKGIYLEDEEDENAKTDAANEKHASFNDAHVDLPDVSGMQSLDEIAAAAKAAAQKIAEEKAAAAQCGEETLDAEQAEDEERASIPKPAANLFGRVVPVCGADAENAALAQGEEDYDIDERLTEPTPVSEEELQREAEKRAEEERLASIKKLLNPYYTLNLTTDQAKEKIHNLVESQLSLRELLYKIVLFGQKSPLFSETEAFIQSTDEYRYGHPLQSPYSLIHMLAEVRGFVLTAVDEQGEEVTFERCENLSADEADDLVADYRITVTDEAREEMERLSPASRIAAQIAQKPHRKPIFLAVLRFCEEPHTFPEITEFFKSENFALDVVADHHTLAPDFFVDKLEKAGGLIWKGVWVTTEEGRRYLEESTQTLDK